MLRELRQFELLSAVGSDHNGLLNVYFLVVVNVVPWLFVLRVVRRNGIRFSLHFFWLDKLPLLMGFLSLFAIVWVVLACIERLVARWVRWHGRKGLVSRPSVHRRLVNNLSCLLPGIITRISWTCVKSWVLDVVSKIFLTRNFANFLQIKRKRILLAGLCHRNWVLNRSPGLRQHWTLLRQRFSLSPKFKTFLISPHMACLFGGHIV